MATNPNPGEEAQTAPTYYDFETAEEKRASDEAFRTSSEYAAYCRETSDALHAAMGEAA